MDHTMSDLAAELPPDAVKREPRYQQVTHGSHKRAIWHLDGIDWHAAPAPRRGHAHWAQTIGATSPFHETWRCPCGAFNDPYRRGGWIYLDKPRVSGPPIVPAARPRLRANWVQVVLVWLVAFAVIIGGSLLVGPPLMPVVGEIAWTLIDGVFGIGVALLAIIAGYAWTSQ